ncbi:MAG: hypothetical protein KA974_11540 [Saprospiraceae bacterium]|nr:hypothetical protein [Saprospiraceae bacterium]MBP7679658.1 hypothetical protein [Saprospiraceae bacterium]
MYQQSRIYIAVILSCWVVVVASAQQDTSSINYEKRYREYITKERIGGIYIPKDLGDVFNQLNKLVDEPSKQKFKAVDEATAANKLHFSLGRWMVVNWNLYEGSRLSVYLNSLGIADPEEMAEFMIITYHRFLHKKIIDAKKLCEEYKANKEKRKEELLKKGTILEEYNRKKQ